MPGLRRKVDADLRAIYGVSPGTLDTAEWFALAEELYTTVTLLVARTVPSGTQIGHMEQINHIEQVSSRYAGSLYEWLRWYQIEVVQWVKARYGSTGANEQMIEAAEKSKMVGFKTFGKQRTPA